MEIKKEWNETGREKNTLSQNWINLDKILKIDSLHDLANYLWLPETYEMILLRKKITQLMKEWKEYKNYYIDYDNIWKWVVDMNLKIIRGPKEKELVFWKLNIALMLLKANLYLEWWKIDRYNEEILWCSDDDHEEEWIINHSKIMFPALWSAIETIYNNTKNTK